MCERERVAGAREDSDFSPAGSQLVALLFFRRAALLLEKSSSSLFQKSR